MKTTTSETRLVDILQQLEASLESPLVPGEYATWASAADEALGAVQREWEHRIGTVHADALDEITQADVALTPRVDELKRADTQLLARVNALCERSRELSEKTATAEPDEHQVEDDLKSFSDDALRLVIDLRKQEAAVSTWLMESVDRDRGTAD